MSPKRKEWKCHHGHVKGHENGSLTVMVKIPATSVLTYTRLAEENSDGCLSEFVRETSELFVREMLEEDRKERALAEEAAKVLKVEEQLKSEEVKPEEKA